MRSQNRFPRIGFLYAALAALLWAASGAAAKHLFNQGVTPFELSQLRMTMGAAGLGLYFLFRSPALLRAARRDLPLLAVLGLSLAAAQFTYLYAISLIQVAAAILLQYQAPTIIAIHGVVRGRERLTAALVLSVAMAAAGCYLVVGGQGLDFAAMSRLGVGVGLLAAGTFAGYTILSDRATQRYPAETTVFYALAFAAVIWNVARPPFSAFFQPYGWRLWPWIIGVGLVGTILPFGLYMAAVRLIRPTCASITATMEPILAAAIAWGLLGEALNAWQVVGAAMVVAAIATMQVKRDIACRGTGGDLR